MAADNFDLLLHWVYGSATKSPALEPAVQLLVAGDKYGITDLVKTASRIVISHIHNCSQRHHGDYNLDVQDIFGFAVATYNRDLQEVVMKICAEKDLLSHLASDLPCLHACGHMAQMFVPNERSAQLLLPMK